MAFKLTILGSSAAVPTQYRNLSSHVLEHEQALYLIDCGEGTQLQMLKYGIKRNRIDHIFISHLHGDHYFGLIGLLNTFSLTKREKPITIYAPQDIIIFLESTRTFADYEWSFPLNIIPLQENFVKTIFENKFLEIQAVPLVHGIPTWGFVFREKEKERNVKSNFIETYNPNYLTIKEIKKGSDFIDSEGNKIENRHITIPPPSVASYAYFSDTILELSLAKSIEGINTLYHEATFSNEEEDLACARFHTTARQAAILAEKSKVKRLLMGHISARFLNNISVLEDQAKEIFPNSSVVSDGAIYEI